MASRARPRCLSRAPLGSGRPWALLAWGFTLAAVASLVLPASPGGAQDVALPLGTPAPQADLEDLSGNPVQLLDYAAPGKPALIEFWASWCENCAALQPQLDGIQTRWGDSINIVAVAVAVGQTPRRVERYLEGHDPGYPFLWDGKGAAVRAYNATTTSIVVMLDAAGRVVYAGVGPHQDLTGEVEALIRKSGSGLRASVGALRPPHSPGPGSLWRPQPQAPRRRLDPPG